MRNYYSCLWSSSYDRGIEHLLEIWPDVKKAVPQAELNITYGWNLFDAAFPDNPERHAWKAEINKMMNQPGIKHLGRIGQKDMIELLKKTSIWAYPTNFQEISCISAMKAQLYGSIPVTMDYAALKETVKFGVKVKGDIADPKVKEVYKLELIGWLKDVKKQEKERVHMMKWAYAQFGWSKVAGEWVEEFKTPRIISKEKEIAFKDFVFKKVVKDG